MHLASIGYRIAAANAGTCARPQMITGMVLHDLTQYDPAVRPAVTRAFSLDGGYGVLQVVPGSAAERAGVRIDDEIVSVGGQPVADPSLAQRSAKSSRRVRQFTDWLSATLHHGARDLVVNRNGRRLTVRLQGQQGCGGEVMFAASSTLNAWSDGRHVVVTSAMAQMARSDDELAFVIAHEMAHNSLGHAGSKAGDARGLFGLLGFGAARIKRMEIDADSHAVALMSAGGYVPQAGISFLENARRRMWWSVSLDHPGFGRRMQIVGSAIAQLASRSAPQRWAKRDFAPTAVAYQTATTPPLGATGTALALNGPPRLASLQTH